MARWARGEHVIILGAGATRGASWVDKTSACLPPLNADFFTQLQRIQSKKHQGVVSEILRDVVGLYGANFSLTLEQYFTQLESLIQLTEVVTLKHPLYPKDRLERMKARLLRGVSAALEESADVVKKTSTASKEPCLYHAALVKALSARDTIISFNYDCVVDHALRTDGTGKWSARYGYGFDNPPRIQGYERWSADKAPGENASINLLKLHGSLNFFPFPDKDPENQEPIRLRQRTFRQTGNEVYEIVPPEFAKRIDRPVFVTLWKRAERAVRLARRIALIGFSFTPTDVHVDSFFRTALAQNKKLEQVIIVNPDVDDRRRIRSVFASQLSRNVRVTQFEYFRDFASQAKALLSME